MEFDQNTLNYIYKGLEAMTSLIEDPKKLREAVSHLERLTHELETLGKSADLLPVDEVKIIDHYIDTLQAYLVTHLAEDKVPKDLIEYTLYVIGRLNTVDTMLEYYLVKYHLEEAEGASSLQ